jgi:RHS repeat-associated protein
MGPFGDNFTETFSTLDFTGFAGGFWDAENNGEQFGAREYENTHGSWLTPDPAGMAAVDLSNPQSWNRYAYVLDNPVSYVDPTGLFRVGPLAYAGYYTFGCDDMNGGGLLNNCDFLNPFSGMQGILLSQLTDPMLAEWSGLGPSYLCGGESLGLPCGLPSPPPPSLGDILGIDPQSNCDFGPCDSGIPGASGFEPLERLPVSPMSDLERQLWKDLFKLYLCGKTPFSNLRTYTLEGLGKGAVMGGIFGSEVGPAGTVLGVAGGALEGFFGGNALGWVATAACQAAGKYGPQF